MIIVPSPLPFLPNFHSVCGNPPFDIPNYPGSVLVAFCVSASSAELAAETLLNGALDEDTLDDGWANMMLPIPSQSFDRGA